MRSLDRPIALKTAESAIDNVGVTEVGENRGPSIELYQQSCVPPLQPGAPWCAAFVRYRMRQAAHSLGLTYDTTFPRSGWTPDWARWARENNKWLPVSEARNNHQVIRKGDLALFWFEGLGRIGHIGIIVSANSKGLSIVEGNTSDPNADGVDRDGDGVYLKRRSWSALGKFGGVLMVDF